MTSDPPSNVAATPVVALHSLFFDGSMFTELRADTGRRVIAPDHRGQGSRSSEPAGSIQELANDVVQLLDELAHPVHLVGSSMGAYVAMLVAAQRPEAVMTCVLSAATADVEARPEVFAALVARLRTEGPAAMVDDLSALMFGSAFLRQAPPSLLHWRERFATRGTQVADAVEQVVARPDLRQAVASLPMPVLLLAGALDTAKSPADMQRIADRIGCSPPVVFDRSGHTPFIEQPLEVARALQAFWNTHDTGRTTHG